MRGVASFHRQPCSCPALRPGTALGPPSWKVPVGFSALGGLALALGLLVYRADRDATAAWLLPANAALATGPVFGALGQWLPSFVHPFAFSLFSAAGRPRPAAPAYRVCAAWWAVNMAFELGQHAQISSHIAEFLQRAFGDTWLTQLLSNYFVRGSFDVGDLIAATAGALAAALVMHLFHRLETHHAD